MSRYWTFDLLSACGLLNSKPASLDSICSTLRSSRLGSGSASSALSSSTPSPESFLADIDSFWNQSACKEDSEDDSHGFSSVEAGGWGDVMNGEMDMLKNCEPGLGVQFISEVRIRICYMFCDRYMCA